MTQSALVKRIIDENTAEVAVKREGACVGNCASCGGCAHQGVIITTAKNPLRAAVGDRVTLQSQTSKILGAAALIYLLPLVFALVAYIISASLSLPDNLCALFSLLGLVVGLLAAIAVHRLNKGRNKITFVIAAIEH